MKVTVEEKLGIIPDSKIATALTFRLPQIDTLGYKHTKCKHAKAKSA